MNRTICIVLAFAAAASAPASAESDLSNDIEELKQQIQGLTEAVTGLTTTVKHQQQELDALKRENESLKQLPAAIPADMPPAYVAPTSAAPSGSAFNPEIGFVADIVGSLTESREDEEGNDRFAVRELELTIGQDIDPYTRFDSTITFSDFEEVGVEEAFITWLEVPGGFQLRTGRMRPIVGKATSAHRDGLDSVDEPLVVQRYLGVEGYFRTGVEASRFLPQFAPRLTQQVIGGVLEGGIGEDGTLFGETRRHPTYYAHLKNFIETSASSSLEFGGTYMRGSSGEDDRGDVDVVGLDATFIHQFGSFRRLKLQAEAYGQWRDETPEFLDDTYGYYFLGDYRFGRRWGAGGRFDRVELIEADPAFTEAHETAYSAWLTFFQSEFARLRLQYQHAELADGENDDRIFLQALIAIGAHKDRVQ